MEHSQNSLRNKMLLYCGILYLVIYIIADTTGVLSWESYDYFSYSVSELSAINAPTRGLVIPLFTLSDLLLLAFGAGVFMVSKSRALRIASLMIISIAIVGRTIQLFFPMHLREDAKSLTDTMHIILTSVQGLFIMLAVGFGSGAKDKGFRIYSILTIIALAVFAFLSGMEGPNIDKHLPTYWLGLYERMDILFYLLWIAALAFVLLGKEKENQSLQTGKVQIPV